MHYNTSREAAACPGASLDVAQWLTGAARQEASPAAGRAAGQEANRGGSEV